MTRLAAAVFVVLALAGCTTTVPPVQPSDTGAAPASATATPGPSASFPAAWPVPDRSLTPGAIATTDTSRLCPHVDPALEAARPTSAEKAKVYAAYHLAYPQPLGMYEVDHLVPIELGGAPDSPANEWPELNDTPSAQAVALEHLNPAFVHNSKDILEDVLHRDVCAGTVPLSVAQEAIAADWRVAYVKYVGAP